MTVVLVMSDTQLGAGKNLAVDRLADQEAVLNQIADLADSEQVDLCVHGGDVMDSRTPSEEARMVFKRFAARIGTERPFVVIAGDHDLRNAELAAPLDLYDHCRFVRRPEVLQFGDLFLACLPWAPPGKYVVSTNGQDRAQISATIAELMIDVARDLYAQIPDDSVALLVGHCPVSSEILPTGLPVEQISKPVLPLTDLDALGFDLCAFGDIHVPAMLAPGVLSIGATAFVNFGEEGVDHGCWIIDTDGVLDCRFVPLEDRRFHTIDVELNGDPSLIVLYDDETDCIAGEMATFFPLTDATVRLRVKATAEQIRRVDFAAIRKLADDAGVHRLVIAPPDIERVERARVEGVTEALSVPEALDLYLEHNEVGARAEALRVLTGELLEEVQA